MARAVLKKTCKVKRLSNQIKINYNAIVLKMWY